MSRGLALPNGVSFGLWIGFKNTQFCFVYFLRRTEVCTRYESLGRMWKLLSNQPPKEPKRVPRGPDPLAALASEAAAGEPAAVRQLLVKLAPQLLRVARRVLGKAHADQHDVAQEAAWALLKALPRFRGDCSVAHFAGRVAFLTALRVRRRDATERHKRSALQRLHDCAGEHSVTPYAELSRTRSVELLRELLDQLPDAQAEALGLHHVVGLTAVEIASVTGAPLQTVRTRLRRARKELRRVAEADSRLELPAGVSHGVA